MYHTPKHALSVAPMSSLLKTILLVFKEVLQWFFPLSEDERRIEDQTSTSFTRKLQVRTVRGTIVLSSFADPDVRAAIHLVKFHRHPHALSLTSGLLVNWLRAHVDGPAVIVPIPLSSKRLRKRGYNQATLVAEAAARHCTTVTIDEGILKRHKDTTPQTTLKRSDRQKNVKDAFVVANKKLVLSDQHIILFDDVMTTGATLKAAKAALMQLKPRSITCVALSH